MNLSYPAVLFVDGADLAGNNKLRRISSCDSVFFVKIILEGIKAFPRRD
jgi:hypothetical protein